MSLLGEIRAHEMGILGMTEEGSSRKNIAFKAKTNKTHKLKHVKQESSEQEGDDDDGSSSEEDDGELALLMKKFTWLNSRINKRGYNFDAKKNMFRSRGVTRPRLVTIVVRRVTSPQIAQCRTRGSSKAKASTVKTQVAMMKKKMQSIKEEASITKSLVMMRKKTLDTRARASGRRKAMRILRSSSQRKEEMVVITRGALW